MCVVKNIYFSFCILFLFYVNISISQGKNVIVGTKIKFVKRCLYTPLMLAVCLGFNKHFYAKWKKNYRFITGKSWLPAYNNIYILCANRKAIFFNNRILCFSFKTAWMQCRVVPQQFLATHYNNIVVYKIFILFYIICVAYYSLNVSTFYIILLYKRTKT